MPDYGVAAGQDRQPTCYNCGSTELKTIYEVNSVPVNSCRLMPSLQAAVSYPTGQLQLAFCQKCGFIENVLFDPEMSKYSADYEETQGFSARFNEFARDLASRLVEKYDLHDKDILEIGCGKGEFLMLLCELGGNRGLGIDPSYIEGRLQSEALSRTKFITDFYSEKYAHLLGDFVLCRHTLEHIQPTREFVQLLRRSIGDRREIVVFFEVPDVLRVLREGAFWDVYYEHCSYFSIGSLARLFRSCGFDVVSLEREFDDQYLCVTARPGSGGETAALPEEDDFEELVSAAAQFGQISYAKISEWREDLRAMQRAGQRAVLWGSGSKAVAYLTTMGVRDEITAVVDINPNKHGRHLPVTGQKIIAPAELKEIRPDVVIAVNPIYTEEIQRDLDRMGVQAKLISL